MWFVRNPLTGFFQEIFREIKKKILTKLFSTMYVLCNNTIDITYKYSDEGGGPKMDDRHSDTFFS